MSKNQTCKLCNIFPTKSIMVQNIGGITYVNPELFIHGSPTNWNFSFSFQLEKGSCMQMKHILRWEGNETHDVHRSEKTKPRMFIESEKKKVIMPLKWEKEETHDVIGGKKKKTHNIYGTWEKEIHNVIEMRRRNPVHVYWSDKKKAIMSLEVRRRRIPKCL